jgi:hypothetical protein
MTFGEAQSLQIVLDGKFRSRYDKIRRAHYCHRLFKQWKNQHYHLPIIVLSHAVLDLDILSLDEVLSSIGIAKPDLKIDIHRIWKMVRYPSCIVKDYRSKLINLIEEDYELIYKYFHGRFRPIITCLEEIIMGKNVKNI